MGEAAPGEVTQVAAATSSQDPQVGLAAVAALRGLVEVLEALQVENARVLGLARAEADRFDHRSLGPEHLVLGVLRDGSSEASRVLEAQGVDLAAAREALGRLVDRLRQTVTAELGGVQR